MAYTKGDKTTNVEELEDLAIGQLKNALDDQFPRRGLCKEVLQLSEYLDRYIVSKQKYERTEWEGARP